jgi:hypothetical protein
MTALTFLSGALRMPVNKAVHRLHLDLQRLRKAKTERASDVRDLRKDKRELSHDQTRLKKHLAQGRHDHALLDRHAKALKAVAAARTRALAGVAAERAALIQSLPAQIEDPANPGTMISNPELTAGLAVLDQKVAALRAAHDPKVAAARARVLADRGHLKADRARQATDRREIRHDRKVVAHDRKELTHDAKVVKSARHKALEDLRPAEYKMGLKATNKARHELGLSRVSHVIRPGVGNATATMRRLGQAGRSVAMSMGGFNSQGRCAAGVSSAIVRTMGIKVWGNGNQIDNNLPRSRFKQVNIPLAKALKIPGMILTWEHTSTTLGRRFGHTAITTGDGHSSCSDFIERNTLAGNRTRTGLKIFMPR